MERTRQIIRVLHSKPTMEGAGVRLKRVFGFGEEGDLEPFLLLDDFRSDQPEAYLKGFPWHPHRGIETITYMVEGSVEHGDSLGNEGVIDAGEVQWMTAGSGIVHQEMPKGDEAGRMGGFQLWANLPASHKMMRPRYREVKSSQIPEIRPRQGVLIRVISGRAAGAEGPVRDVVTDPAYVDVSIEPGVTYVHPTKPGHTVFAYVIDGGGAFGGEDDPSNETVDGTLVLYDDGDQVSVRSGEAGVRFLLVSGKPIGEPIAWRGPIVMNTEEELQKAFEEYRSGTFIKHTSEA